MKLKVMSAALTMVTLVFAQSGRKPVLVSDQSPKDSPVTLSGSLSFGPAQGTLDIRGSNHSGQPVLAIVIEIKGDPWFSWRDEHDHFYKRTEIMAHGEFIVGNAPIVLPYERPTINDKPTSPQAAYVRSVEARVLWVQFEDGTTWGDEAIGKQVRVERAELKDMLTHLLDVQRMHGDAAFLQALSEPQRKGSSAEAVAAGFQQLQKLNGTPALVAHIQERLRIGSSHPFNP